MILIINSVLTYTTFVLAIFILEKNFTKKTVKYITPLSIFVIIMSLLIKINIIKIAALIIILSLIIKNLTNNNTITSYVSALYIYGNIIISEIIGIGIILLITNITGYNYLEHSIILINIIVYSIAIIIINIKVSQKLYCKIKYLLNKQNCNSKMLFEIIFIFINFLIILNYQSSLAITSKQKYIISNISTIAIVVCLIIIVIHNFNLRTNKKAQDDEIKILKQKEEQLDEERINNHENKNQLLIIKNMINESDKDLNAYINQLIKEQYGLDEELNLKISFIPSGGLKGIISQKIKIINNKKIKYQLNIDLTERINMIGIISETDIISICKIVGSLLDNAIEEVEGTKKLIEINLKHRENKFIIEIKNHLKNKKPKLAEKSTKGIGRGNGLKLINKLVNKKSNLEFETKITSKEISQILSVTLDA